MVRSNGEGRGGGVAAGTGARRFAPTSLIQHGLGLAPLAAGRAAHRALNA